MQPTSSASGEPGFGTSLMVLDHLPALEPADDRLQTAFREQHGPLLERGDRALVRARVDERHRILSPGDLDRRWPPGTSLGAVVGEDDVDVVWISGHQFWLLNKSSALATYSLMPLSLKAAVRCSNISAIISSSDS